MSDSHERPLTSRVEDQIPQWIRRRGRAYHLSKAVCFVRGDEGCIETTVQGADLYRVVLRVEDMEDALTCSCTCPYFTGNYEACKHIWATMLEAESRGLLADAAAMSDLFLEFYDEEIFGPELAGADDSPDDEAGEEPRPAWEEKVSRVARAVAAAQGGGDQEHWSPDRQIVYVLDVPETLKGHGLNVEVGHRKQKQNGEWSKLKVRKWDQKEVNHLPDPADRRILSLLLGGYDPQVYRSYNYYGGHSARSFELPLATHRIMVRLMCATGRCMLRRTPLKDDLVPLAWDDGPAWHFSLDLKPNGSSKKSYVLAGALHRNGRSRPLSEPAMLTAGGIVLADRRAAALDFGSDPNFAWISLLRREGRIEVPAGEVQDLLEKLLALPEMPKLDLSEELSYREEKIDPRPVLKIAAPGRDEPGVLLGAYLSFDYEGALVEAGGPERGVYRPADRRFLLRNRGVEREAVLRLKQLGLKGAGNNRRRHNWHFELVPRRLARVVGALTESGWRVEAEGKVFRQAETFRMSVASNIDWFELRGRVDFGGQAADLPELLAAMKSGEQTVRLGDGTFGILPEEWLRRFGAIGSFGETEEDHIRFRESQVALLDGLLAALPEADLDAQFRKARERLRSFDGIEPRDEPAGFRGKLRDYQRDGLGWLHFLLTLGFGGCLADDMGLGKTIQMLALLENRRSARAGGKSSAPEAPSLVVVPRSLVYNWYQEAGRFCPKLKVLDHTGIHRFGREVEDREKRSIDHFDEYDVILTTYGTLRRDITVLKEKRFDIVVLDEAQAIKNASSATAKASRLLRADFRVALSGTPIENHLGELWSLFEFLNPGMLGSSRTGALLQASGRKSTGEDAPRLLLARALRPYILRRTKEQVARDLPEKLEHTIFCELETKQRRLYDELRGHYRNLLLRRVDSIGLGRSKMQVLEALLRLRQAACHPGLIDEKHRRSPSAKLDMLVPQLTEVLDEGHKALVFSQFTSMLALLRPKLDNLGMTYEYLDGRTRKRQDRVERFQTDPDCRLFLISLKAGGLGLNLTAADYVFLLDPWWNPAVEAQAIDRAHRIGQTRPVFAYRLIARNTVEEKVLELQKVKRDLADAIINADNSLIRDLTREDLENLLG